MRVKDGLIIPYVTIGISFIYYSGYALMANTKTLGDFRSLSFVVSLNRGKDREPSQLAFIWHRLPPKSASCALSRANVACPQVQLPNRHERGNFAQGGRRSGNFLQALPEIQAARSSCPGHEHRKPNLLLRFGHDIADDESASGKRVLNQQIVDLESASNEFGV